MQLSVGVALVLLVCLCVQSEALLRFERTLDESLDEHWEKFKTVHNKKYHQGNEFYRRLIWEDNVKKIHRHNLEYDLGKHSYTLGVNAMSDLTFEEFQKFYLPGFGGKLRDSNNTVTFMPPKHITNVPDAVDWRDDGYVTPVKNQGQCGSCWSFSTTGTLEGQYFRQKGVLESFSEQQLVDCSGDFGPGGCNGGWPDDAISYIAKYGIEREEAYPYTARDGTCRYTVDRVVTKAKGTAAIPRADENAMKVALATVGPLSICIDANHPGFMQYKDGVYDEPKCTTSLDHAVLAVGYGTSADGKDYWIVKNSWGTTWGQAGYVLMSRNKKNQCGVAEHARYPLM